MGSLRVYACGSWRLSRYLDAVEDTLMTCRRMPLAGRPFVCIFLCVILWLWRSSFLHSYGV